MRSADVDRVGHEAVEALLQDGGARLRGVRGDVPHVGPRISGAPATDRRGGMGTDASLDDWGGRTGLGLVPEGGGAGGAASVGIVVPP